MKPDLAKNKNTLRMLQFRDPRRYCTTGGSDGSARVDADADMAATGSGGFAIVTVRAVHEHAP